MEIPLPNGLSCTPVIRVESRVDYYDFYDVDAPMSSGIQHAAWIRIERELIGNSWFENDEEERQEKADWEALRSLDIVGSEDFNRRHVPIWNDERLLIGHLVVQEFPVELKNKYTNSWVEFCNEIGADTGELGAIADKIEDSEDYRLGMALIDGALFIPRTLTIHPAFRGHQLGIRLLGHTPRALSTSSSDVVIASAFPVDGIFEKSVPDRSAAAIRKLVKYYERLGFKTWRKRPAYRDGKSIPIYAFIGSYPLTEIGGPEDDH